MKNLPRNFRDWIILDSWVCNLILADKLFTKALESLEACLPVNNLCKKLVWSLESPITFNKRFQVISVLFFIYDFNLLSCN